MKTKILAFAIAIAASAGLATAAAQSNPAATQAQTCAKAGNKAGMPQSFTDYAFEGILLTPDQQAQVDGLNAGFKARRDSVRCQRPDSVCVKGANPRMQARRDYVNGVKQVLTPEQYTMFLENIVFMPQQPQGGPGMKQGCKASRDKAYNGDKTSKCKGDKASKKGKKECSKAREGSRDKAMK